MPASSMAILAMAWPPPGCNVPITISLLHPFELMVSSQAIPSILVQVADPLMGLEATFLCFCHCRSQSRHDDDGIIRDCMCWGIFLKCKCRWLVIKVLTNGLTLEGSICNVKGELSISSNFCSVSPQNPGTQVGVWN